MKIKYTIRGSRRLKRALVEYLINWAYVIQIDVVKSGWFLNRTYDIYLDGNEKFIDDFLLQNKIENYIEIK
jgi:hypothetical protein